MLRDWHGLSLKEQTPAGGSTRPVDPAQARRLHRDAVRAARLRWLRRPHRCDHRPDRHVRVRADPLLQDDAADGRIVGIARRPFDPSEHGWSKLEYRQGDVRDLDALEQAFPGADVVVHLAFIITGRLGQTTRAINVEGTLNAFRAAAEAAAQRFVYASSVAAYGFHADNPIGMTEDWPVRPAALLFYAQEKAEIGAAAGRRGAEHPRASTCTSCGRRSSWARTLGAKAELPGPLQPLALAASEPAWPACRCRSPPSSPDLARCSSSTRTTSARRCGVRGGRWPARRYIAADDVLTVADVVLLALRPCR